MIDGLTSFDYGVMILIGLSTLFAFVRGFTTVALSFGAWFGALFISFFGYSYAAPYVGEFISPKELADFILLVGVFILALILLKFIAGQIGDAVKDSPVGFLDRSLGAVFGFLRGVVMIAALFTVYDLFSGGDEPDWIADAKSRPLVAWSSDILRGLAGDALSKKENDPIGDIIASATKEAEKAAESIGQDIAEQYTKKGREALEATLSEIAAGAAKDSDEKEKDK